MSNESKTWQGETNDHGEKIGPWRRLDSTTVYENPWIRITHENAKTPPAPMEFTA